MCEEWLANSELRRGRASPKSCLILLGGQAPEFPDLDVYHFNSATIKNSKEMQDLLTKAATLTSFIPKPNLAIFDDLDMLVQHDRVFLNSLLETLQKQRLPAIPIIMIFPVGMEKKTRPFVAAGAKLIKCEGEHESGAGDQGAGAGSTDPWFAPLCFHENLLKQIGTKPVGRRAYIKFLDSLCDWNYMMSRDFTAMATELITLETNMITQKFKIKPAADQEFTKILSQLSLYKKKERVKYLANDSLFCM